MRIAIARYIKCPDNYFFDIFDAVAAGSLRALGHQAIVVERVSSPALAEEDILDGLLSFLQEFGPSLVFIPYLPNQELARRVREMTGARIVAVGSRLMLECPHVDFVIGEPDPLACVELVEALEGKRSFDQVGILAYRESGALRVSAVPLHPIAEIFSRGTIDYDAFYRLGPGIPVEQRKHVVGDWGCFYRNHPFSSPQLEGLECPPGVAAGGCTFCSRPAMVPLPWEVKEELLGRQIDEVLASFPDLAKLIVIDEQALRFVDDLARLVLTRPLDGVELLISGRLDLVERHCDRLEQALAMLAGRNRIRLYQFGIENLADTALERYNKGMDFPTIERACQLIEQLESRHRNLGVEESFGFICFDPWTTIAELQQNVERSALIDLHRLREQAPFTSLRLFPEVPLYWKARAEGLLTGRIDDNEFGYSVNSGWRFKHDETRRVYDELARLRGAALPWDLVGQVLTGR
jgi:hypothetical protein